MRASEIMLRWSQEKSKKPQRKPHQGVNLANFSFSFKINEKSKIAAALVAQCWLWTHRARSLPCRLNRRVARSNFKILDIDNFLFCKLLSFFEF